VPLFILAASMFHQLFPLAIASLALSLGVCLAAGAQAEIPANKIRWWSRPVVGLLFFLQPIVRGWARYQGQLGLQSSPANVHETLESVSLRNGSHSLDEICYWGNDQVDRIEFVKSILDRLDRDGWPNKSDIGWSEYDLEVLGNRWAHLQLTTVSEIYPRGKQMIRCRLRAGWTLQAKVAFWSMLGFELLLLGVVGKWLPWLNLIWLSVPLFAWFLFREKRTMQSLLAVLLDEVAQKWSMSKVPFEIAEQHKQRAS
jgi:hypothetical protein